MNKNTLNAQRKKLQKKIEQEIDTLRRWPELFYGGDDPLEQMRARIEEDFRASGIDESGIVTERVDLKSDFGEMYVKHRESDPLKGLDLLIWRTSQNLGVFGQRHTTRGIIAMGEDDPACWDLLHSAAEVRVLCLLLDIRRGQMKTSRTEDTTVGVEEMMVASGIGADQTADLLASWRAIGASATSGLRTFLGALRLIALGEWDLVKKAREEHNFGVYDQVLDAWENDAALSDAVLAMLEHHMAEMKKSDYVGNFAVLEYRLWPLEWFALKRVRTQLGLSVPEIDHPLLVDNPYAKEPPADCVPTIDPILQRIDSLFIPSGLREATHRAVPERCWQNFGRKAEMDQKVQALRDAEPKKKGPEDLGEPMIKPGLPPEEKMKLFTDFLGRWMTTEKDPEFDPAKYERKQMPEPLRRLWQVAGQWKHIFYAQDWIAWPEAFKRDDGRLVFAGENQDVWICATDLTGEDPPVWVLGGGYDEWTQVCDSLTDFLITLGLQELIFASPDLGEDPPDFAAHPDAIPLWVNHPYIFDDRVQSYYLLDEDTLAGNCAGWWIGKRG